MVKSDGFLFADVHTFLALIAASEEEADLSFWVYRFRIRAPPARNRTPFDKGRRPYAGTVMETRALNVKYCSLFHRSSLNEIAVIVQPQSH